MISLQTLSARDLRIISEALFEESAKTLGHDKQVLGDMASQFQHAAMDMEPVRTMQQVD